MLRTRDPVLLECKDGRERSEPARTFTTTLARTMNVTTAVRRDCDCTTFRAVVARFVRNFQIIAVMELFSWFI
jgi:hypothetical protein